MKKPVLQSMALASLAAGSLGSAHAALVSPSFGCLSANATDGGTVSWGDYSTVTAPTLSFDFFDDTFDSSSKLDCSGGVLSETVVGRKSGEGQKDFIVVKLQEVLTVGMEQYGDIKLGFTQALGELVGGVQTYENYWNITNEYKFAIDNALFTSTSFLGIKLTTAHKFDGQLATIAYDKGEFTFRAELPLTDATLSLTSTPRAINDVSEPGTLALLGTGLLGAAALRRRRRGW
jgi:hypothetical protein